MVKDKLFPFKVLSVASILISLSIAYIILSQIKLPSIQLPTITPQISELSTDGFVEVKPDAGVIDNVGVVSLTGGCYQVTANTDATQAESIVNGLEGKISVRPNTHDLMRDVFESLGIKVLIVKVVDLKDSNYIGRLIVKQGDNILSLDSRPSDGIAIAVRTNSTIYFKESLMKERGKYIC